MMGQAGLGSIPPSQANAFRGLADIYLKHLEPPQASVAPARVDLEQLRKQVREQPWLLDIVKSILTDEELAQLIDDEGDADAKS